MSAVRFPSLRRLGAALSFGVIEQILLSGSSLAFTAIMAHALGPFDFGWFSIAFACLMFMEVGGWGLFGDGVPATAGRLPSARLPCFRTSFLLLSAAYGVVMLLLTLVVGVVCWRFFPLHCALAPATGVAFIGLRLQNAARRLYYLDRRRSSAVAAAVVNVTLLTGLTALMLFVGDANPATAMLCLGGASGGAALLFLVRDRHVLARPSSRELWWARRRLWKTGRWLLASGAMSWLGNFGAVLIFGALSDVRASGTLRAALTLITPPSQITNVIMSIIVPENAAVLHRDRRRPWWGLHRRALLLIGGCAGSYALAATLSGERLPLLLFGPVASDMTRVTVAIVTIGFAFESLRYACNSVLFAVGYTHILTISTACSLVVGLIGIVLASSSGLTAVLLAMTIGNNAGTLIVLGYFAVFARRQRLTG